MRGCVGAWLRAHMGTCAGPANLRRMRRCVDRDDGCRADHEDDQDDHDDDDDDDDEDNDSDDEDEDDGDNDNEENDDDDDDDDNDDDDDDDEDDDNDNDGDWWWRQWMSWRVPSVLMVADGWTLSAG